MSHPQPKLRTAAELIELHSKARVRSADSLKGHAVFANMNAQRSGNAAPYRKIEDKDARAQVARLR